MTASCKKTIPMHTTNAFFTVPSTFNDKDDAVCITMYPSELTANPIMAASKNLNGLDSTTLIAPSSIICLSSNRTLPENIQKKDAGARYISPSTAIINIFNIDELLESLIRGNNGYNYDLSLQKIVIL